MRLCSTYGISALVSLLVSGRFRSVGYLIPGSLVDSRGLGVIDWLNIDVKGHEMSVLEGGRSALAKTRRLILEVSEGNENACKEMVKDAGLDLVFIEKEMGTRVSSWLITRKT